MLCQTGRWTLALTKDDVVVFALFCVEWGTEVVIAGPKFDAVIHGRWNHICGTFDGAVARLFINGWECGSADVQERALKIHSG